MGSWAVVIGGISVGECNKVLSGKLYFANHRLYTHFFSYHSMLFFFGRSAMPRVLFLVNLLVFSLGVVSASATEVCMPQQIYVSPSGNDNNAGTRNAPLENIQTALNRMSGGDEVILLDGTYLTNNEVGLYFRSGTASQPTIVRAENPWGAKIMTTAQFQAFTVQDSDHVLIEGIEVGIQDPATQPFPNTSGFTSTRSNYVTFRNCYAHDFGCNGFSFQNGDYGTFEGNVSEGNAETSALNCSGFSVYQPNQLDNAAGYHIIIRGNVAFANRVDIPFVNGDVSADQPTDGNGIILDDYNNTQNGSTNGKFTAATLIENNLCFNNGGSGIKVFETENAMVRHNTCYHNLEVVRDYAARFGEIDISFTPGASLTVANNVAVSRDDDNTWAMNYTPAINPENGYMQRYRNILVGQVRMPDESRFWDAYGDMVQPRSQQDYPEFLNPTETVTAGFTSVDDFDQYFRLTNDSPGNDASWGGQDYLMRNIFATQDLEGVSRPTTGGSEIGAFEGTVMALPATLVDFTGRPAGKVNELVWEVTAQVNVSHYELERSADGRNHWALVERITAEATENSRYTATDATPLAHNYYRLRTVDADGTVTISPYVYLSAAALAELRVYPNPATDRLWVDSAGGQTATLYSAAGRRLMEVSLTEGRGQLDLSAYPRGGYLLRVVGVGGLVATRWVSRL